MKIAFITDNLNSGGAQRQLITLALGLKEQGHEVTFIVYNPGYHYEQVLSTNDIRVLKLLKKGKHDLSLIPRIAGTLRKENVRVIIAFLFAPTIVSVLSTFFSARRIRTIASERSFSRYRETDFITKLARLSYAFVHHITVNSLSQLKFLQSHYPQYAKKMTYIPNGLDLSHFVPSGKNTANLRLEILCIGHVNSVKNTKLVIQALSHFKTRTNARFRLTWIGRNFDETGKPNRYYEECLSLIDQLELRDEWQWISETKDLVPFYHKADLLIHASIGEGFSNVIMEALACALPVIISDVNDNPLIIRHNVNGFIFPSNDWAAISEILLKYIDIDKAQRQKLSAAARAAAVDNFSQQAMVNRYIALLNQIFL